MSKPTVEVVTLGAPGSGRTMLLAALLARSARRFGTRAADIHQIRHDERYDESIGPWEYQTDRWTIRQYDGRPPWEILPHIADGALGTCGLVVVAADDGASITLREQLRVAALAGMRRLIVFITRADAVADPTWLDLVESDAREALHDADYLGDEVAVIPGDAQRAYFHGGDADAAGCIDAIIAAMDAEFAPARIPAVLALGERITERFADDSVTLSGSFVYGSGLGDVLELWIGGVPTVMRVRLPRRFLAGFHFPDAEWPTFQPILRRAFPLAAAPGVLRPCRRFDLLAWDTADMLGHYGESVLQPRVNRQWHVGTATISTFVDAMRSADGRPLERPGDYGQPVVMECDAWTPTPLTVGLPLTIPGGTGTRARGIVVRLHD